MESTVDRLLDGYEAGALSRRQLASRLMALVATTVASRGAVAAAAEGSSFSAVGLNHIALRVTDVVRSREFYVRRLGLRVARESARSAFLDCGSQFLALFQGERPGLDHYCYSVPGYDQGRAAATLRGVGIEPRLSGRRIYFDDPDGIEVQLAAPDHQA